GARIAHGGQAHGGFAGAGFADQTQHLAALQGQVDALDDRAPDFVALALDLEVAHLQEDIALGARAGWLGVVVHSLSPLVLCRNQSTTKLTPTVSSAIAPAGSSGVRRATVNSILFS